LDFLSTNELIVKGYLWGKTITVLKKELSTIGVGLLGEMTGKNLSENKYHNLIYIVLVEESYEKTN
jgi:hypothetical protein